MTDKKVNKWMNNLDIKRGAFTKQAKRHNMSISEYADYVIYHRKKHRNSGYNPILKTYRRAILYKTFMRSKKKKMIKKKSK